VPLCWSLKAIALKDLREVDALEVFTLLRLVCDTAATKKPLTGFPCPRMLAGLNR